MSDHKWDRLKKAFGVNPSGDLITNRNDKVTAALAIANTEINKLVAAGLPRGMLGQRYDQIAQARLNALALGSPKEKYTALDTAKADARQLVADAPDVVKQQIDQLDADIARRRSEVTDAIKVGDDITTPACRAAIAGPLQAVRDDVDTADRAPNKRAKLDAMEDIDLDPLTQAVNGVRPLQTQIGFIGNKVEWVNKNLPRVTEPNANRAFADRLKIWTDELADFANEADLGKLRARSQTAFDEMTKVQKEVSVAFNDIEGLANARAAIAISVDPAKALRSKAAQAAVDAELKAVEQEIARVNKLTPTRNIIDGLQAKPLRDMLKKLDLAVGLSRDIERGVPKLLAGINAVIGKLPDDTVKRGFVGELAELNRRATALEGEADVDKARKDYDTLRKDADELMNRVVQASGKEGYNDALVARFGVTVVGKNGAKVNLEGAWHALEAVPDGHVGHDKLKTITFTGSSEKGGAYSKIQEEITIDDFSDTDMYTYDIDGKPVKMNGFNVCMLHEIGHAVDEKYKVMAGLMQTAGAGQWKSETPQEAEDKLTDAAIAEMTNPSDPVKQAVRKIIQAALENKPAEKPRDVEIGRSQWKTVQKYAGIANAINAKSKPWFNDNAASLAIGPRVYVDSESGWYSYALAERQAGSVRNYMWRSPAEWFAEVYGVSWLTHKVPLRGIPDKASAWLPS